MTLAKQTMVVLKRRYKGLLNKFTTVEDKFCIQYEEYNTLLKKLKQAHTDLLMVYNRLKDSDDKFSETENGKNIKSNIESLEKKMLSVYNKLKELKSKEKEYVAKIETAIALKEAASVTSSIPGCSISDNVGDIIKECDDMLYRLDAEMQTLKLFEED
ncbi:hypothetical protein HDR60_03285 [bacterium]|nr:hypothetical protein [bacterium]